MDQLRVSVVGPQGLVTEMIEAAIAAEPGVTMVHFDPDSAIERAQRDHGRPDVVVIESTGDELAESWRQVMAVGRDITVLVVDSARGTGVEYAMHPHAQILGEVSPADIALVVRGIAQARSQHPRD